MFRLNLRILDQNSGNQMEKSTLWKGRQGFSRIFILSTQSMYELLEDTWGRGKEAGLIYIGLLGKDSVGMVVGASILLTLWRKVLGEMV